MKRIGIITSGGDCGGLNAVIKGVAREAWTRGIESFVIPNGYAGLYNLVEMTSLVLLDAERVSRIEASLAGSEAGHSRVKISKIADPQKYERIRAGLTKFGIEALVISGGDDTGSVVVDLSQRGIPCIHVPKMFTKSASSAINSGNAFISWRFQASAKAATTCSPNAFCAAGSSSTAAGGLEEETRSGSEAGAHASPARSTNGTRMRG